MSSEKVVIKEDRPTAVQFSEIQIHHNDQELIDTAKKRLRRASTSGSQAIIAYRTLSITVSENQAKGVTKSKKSQKNLAEDLSNVSYHKLSIIELEQQYRTSAVSGLGLDQITSRVKEHGKNAISPPPNNWFKKVYDYFFGGFCPLLWIASIICWISWRPLGDPNPAPLNLTLAIILMAVVFIQAFFNAWQDWSTTRVMDSINNMLPTQCLVVRDGKIITIDAAELVPGDVVHLKMGNKVPADLRLIQVSDDLKFDRSVLTGESDPIPGTIEDTDDNVLETHNVAMMGTHVLNGSGIGVVVSTGDNTLMGRIACLSSNNKSTRTTLQIEIFRFVMIIASLAITVGLVCLITWLAWLRRDYPDFLTPSAALVAIISVLVAFVPEGMPVAVTLCLTIIARRMQKNNIVCKVLTTVETLGSVNVLCSDKTGTLTENKMFVSDASIGRETFTSETCNQICSSGSDTELVPQLTLLQLTAALCNGSHFDSETAHLDIRQRVVFGDATDSAILRFAEGMSPAVATVETMRADTEKVFEIPFNSKNKWMLTIVRPLKDTMARSLSSRSSPVTTKDWVLFCKGAPDIILKRCSKILLPDGYEADLTDKRTEALLNIQAKWAHEGKRVLLLTRRVIKAEDTTDNAAGTSSFATWASSMNTDLVVIGMVAIVDPPRPESAETVEVCRRAGVRFFMVTGDFPTTAAAIARQIGIFTTEYPHTIADLDPAKKMEEIPKYVTKSIDIRQAKDIESQSNSTLDHKMDDSSYKSLLLSGSDMITLNDAQWEQACQYEEIVFARTSPDQKLRIIKEFQKRENVVAMTGDGVNDAPSLKAADIGIAMGGGSDVAMEAADMILLDKFSSIVAAIENGRLVFDNLKKVIIYLLPAGSWSELWPVIVNIYMGGPQTLSSFQMIVICVLNDVFPSMSLMMEKPEAGLLSRPPRNPKKDRLVNLNLLLQAYGFIGLMEMLSSMFMFFYYMSEQGIPPSKVFMSFTNLTTDGYMGYTSEQLNEFINVGQSIYYINLIICQWGNALSSRTRRLSLFQANPFFGYNKNWYIFGAMLISLVIAFIILYIPGIQNVLLTRPVPVKYWFIPFGWAAMIFTLDEIRKLLIRSFPKGPIAKLAW
ncbi:hypothetical protein RMCBS344292_16699 [Rhizopus microsporus]|nr:hypothetical protein RMCBS344292_16699 [Rhizopus microsporus]